MTGRSNSIRVPLKILSLDQEGIHMMLKVKVNNLVARLVLDTGASRTVFDTHRIKRYVEHRHFEKNDHLSTGLGTDKMESHFVNIKKFSIGSIVMNNFNLILLDLKHINHSYEAMGLPAVDGVLGSDILLMYKAVIDYGKPEIRLHQLSTMK